LSGALVPLAGHGSLVFVFRGLGKPRRAGQCLSASVWNAVSKRETPNWTSSFQSSFYAPILSPPMATTPIATIMKKTAHKQLKSWVFESYSLTHL